MATVSPLSPDWDSKGISPFPFYSADCEQFRGGSSRGHQYGPAHGTDTPISASQVFKRPLLSGGMCVTHLCVPVISIQEPEGQGYSHVQTDERNNRGPWPKLPGRLRTSTRPIFEAGSVAAIPGGTQNEAAGARGGLGSVRLLMLQAGPPEFFLAPVSERTHARHSGHAQGQPHPSTGHPDRQTPQAASTKISAAPSFNRDTGPGSAAPSCGVARHTHSLLIPVLVSCSH